MTTGAGPVPVLEVRDLVKTYPAPGRRGRGGVQAVAGVSLQVQAGRTLGLVGESGSGKSTLARCALRLEEPTSGQVLLEGEDLRALSGRQLRARRRAAQILFQDPGASLDPRQRVGAAVEEALRIHRRPGGRARVAELLGQVGLAPDDAGRRPHELSGGQRQRAALARALAVEPRVLVLDEPVSSLDVSVQAGVVNLLADLQAREGLGYLFVAHDLAVVRQVADTVAVMHLGRVVESGPTEEVYNHATHPYTQALLSAVPVADPARARRDDRLVLAGEAPSALDPPSGCRFRTRCWKAQEVCAREEPALVDRGGGHPSACHFAEERPPGPGQTT